MGKLGKILFWVALVAIGAACVGASYYVRSSAESGISSEATFARAEARRIQEQVVLYSERIVPSRIPFHMLLQGLGIDAGTAARMISSAQSVFDLRHLRAGNRLSVGRSVLGDLRSVRYRIDPDRVLLSLIHIYQQLWLKHRNRRLRRRPLCKDARLGSADFPLGVTHLSEIQWLSTPRARIDLGRMPSRPGTRCTLVLQASHAHQESCPP